MTAEIVFDDGSTATVANFMDWMHFLDATMDLDTDWTGEKIEAKDFPRIRQELETLNSNVSQRLLEIIQKAEELGSKTLYIS